MYAKVKDGVVVKFPYGFDELQSEFSTTLTGEINIPNTFETSQAYNDGYRIVFVALEPKPLGHSPGERHYLGAVPEFVDGEWIQRWLVETIPYPTDGKTYDWEPTTRSWVEA